MFLARSMSSETSVQAKPVARVSRHPFGVSSPCQLQEKHDVELPSALRISHRAGFGLQVQEPQIISDLRLSFSSKIF